MNSTISLDDNIRTNRDELKRIIKRMPIWQEFEYLDTDLEKIQDTIRGIQISFNDLFAQLDNLRPFNTTGEPDISEGKYETDVERLYRQNSDFTFRCVSTTSKSEERYRRGLNELEMLYVDESIFLLRERFQANDDVYVQVEPGKPWIPAKIVKIVRRPGQLLPQTDVQGFRKFGAAMIIFYVATQEEPKPRYVKVDEYKLARVQDHKGLLKAPKRVIAGANRYELYPGIIGHETRKDNNWRYLVWHDNKTVGYYRPDQVLPIAGQSKDPWFDFRRLGIADEEHETHMRHFFGQFPMRSLCYDKVGESQEILRDGKFVDAVIRHSDCDIMIVEHEDGLREQLYKGSMRIKYQHDRRMIYINKFKKDNLHLNLVLYADIYYESFKKAIGEEIFRLFGGERITIAKHENRARKSTGARTGPRTRPIQLEEDIGPDDETSDKFLSLADKSKLEDIDFDAIKKHEHRCSPACLDIPGVKTERQVQDIVDEFRNASDLRVPLLLGWKRRLFRDISTRGRRKIVVLYESPCKRIFRDSFSLMNHLRQTKSVMDVDYFSFNREVNPLRRADTQNAVYFLKNLAVDRKTGKPLENKNISVVNCFNEERLPEDFEYKNISFPHAELRRKGFTFNTDFKSSCDCEDDCASRAQCDCHNVSEQFFGRVTYNGRIESRCQYKYKRLPDNQVGTGIFECNSRCLCGPKCPNRVVQNGIRFRLQIHKTLNKGWGVITLDDIPPWSFICTYAAELLDDADQYGDSDMYYADLDFISVNEHSKEGEVEEEPSYVDIEALRNVDVEARARKRKASSDANRNNSNQAGSKYRPIHDLLGSKDFTLDARMQGNVGRFFNHSCDPNSCVQSVFIETHDLRFPEVAFFSVKYIQAMEEITWNYNYKMGSIAGRVIRCNCDSPNCAGRIL